MRPSIPVILAILLIIPGSGAFAADVLPDAPIDETVEMVGDWIIDENTTVINRTIVLEGNLLINEGSLTLINSTLMMKCYADGQFRVDIEGEMHLINSTLSANITENNYYVVIEKSGKLIAENSTIEYAGYQDGERSGVYVLGYMETDNATFRYNYCPLWLEGLKNMEIHDINLYRNAWGIRLVSCENVTLREINIEQNYRTGVWASGGRDNAVKNTRIYLIYRPSGSSNAQGILIENESYDMIRDNRIERTSREAVLIKGGERNLIVNNTLITNNVGAIHLFDSSNNTIKENLINSSYMGILLEYSDYNSINGNEIETSLGVKILDSNFTTILLCKLVNMKYGIMAYFSNHTVIYGINFMNISINLYVKDSMIIYGGHMYSDKYRIYGDSRLYLSRWIKVRVLDDKGDPVSGMPLELWFQGKKISEGTSSGMGYCSFLAPYVVHTSKSKNYSWCEIKAVSSASFQENPVRFYSWDKNEIVLREKASDLDILVFADKKEVMPGDMLNLTITILNRTASVNNASVDITIGGKPVFPPKRIANATYFASIKVPDFENSIKVIVEASIGNHSGNYTLTLMRPSVEYGGNSPSLPAKSEGPGFSWLYVPALLLFLSLMLITMRKKPIKREYSSLKPVSKEGIEIER